LCANLQGLVSGAVAERLGGVGTLCCLGTGSKPPPLTVLYQMNLAPGAKAAVSTTQLADLLAAAQVGAVDRAGEACCSGKGRARAWGSHVGCLHRRVGQSLCCQPSDQL
jgi:hypothetical protein